MARRRPRQDGPCTADGDPPAIGATSAACVVADDPDADTLDGEPTVRFRLLCPRGLRPLWRAAVELARRVAGEPLPIWRAAEAIAAEGLSAIPPEHSYSAAPHEHHPAPAIGSADSHGSRSPSAADPSIGAVNVDPLNARDEATLAVSFPSLDRLADDLDGLDAFALDERDRKSVV
jgi:hypothetical protein